MSSLQACLKGDNTEIVCQIVESSYLEKKRLCALKKTHHNKKFESGFSTFSFSIFNMITIFFDKMII